MKTYRLSLIIALAWAFGLAGCSDSQKPATTHATAEQSTQVATLTEYTSESETPYFAEANGSLTAPEANTPYRKVGNKGLIQKFTIDGNEMTTLRGMNGALFHFPRHCFQDDNGKPIKGNLQIQIVEADDMSDFVALGITTRTASGVLSTQAMYYLNAFYKGHALKINPDTPVLVQLPKNGQSGQKAFFAVHDNEGKPVWRTITPDETAEWKVVEEPVEPKAFVTTYSPEYCAYKCFEKVNDLIGATATPLMEHLQHLAADTLNGGRTVTFANEAMILKSKPKVSRLEKETQKYIFVQDKLYTRDRKGANEAEKLTGLKIIPTKLSGTVLLTENEAVFYNLTPAVEPAEKVMQFLDRYPYLKDNKLNLVALENTANTALKAIEKAPVYQTEEEIVHMIRNTNQADAHPTYFRYKDHLYANLKAVRLFAPTFSMKDEAVHAGKITRAKFNSPAINARFVEYKHFAFMIEDLYADLAKGNITADLPKNVGVDMLAMMSKNILSYRQTATETEKQSIEFFKYRGRFYVSKQYLNPMIHTLAHREGFAEPKLKAHELMNQLATVYHRTELKDPYLRYNYLDMTVAVTPKVHYAKAGEREEVYQTHESMDYIRKNAHQDSLADVARHREALTCNPNDKVCLAMVQTGWVALAKETKLPTVNVQGTIAGVIPDNAVTLHVVCPETRTYLTFASKDGAFNFLCPKGETLKVMAQFGKNIGLMTYQPKNKQLNAGELTLLLRKPAEIDGIIATL